MTSKWTTKWTWTEERIAELRKLHGEGMSGTSIMKAMGAPSRNTIIGKCSRLGLHHSAETIRANNAWENRMGVPRKPKAPPIPRFTHGLRLGTDFDSSNDNAEEKRAQFWADGMSIIARVESGAGVASPNSRPFRDSTGCKWPLASGMVCCNPMARGSYCDGHAAVAYSDPLPVATWSQINSRAMALTRFDGIDLEPDHRVKDGSMGNRARNAPPTSWDAGRDAA
jgi:hypothetical protein